jgi:prephenate dehydrogenase
VAGQLRIPGKHGATAERYAEVTVQLADRSGELARMFVAAADAGINVEDVRIEHVLGRPSGLVSLFVLPGSGESLSASLRARDFDVRD